MSDFRVLAQATRDCTRSWRDRIVQETASCNRASGFCRREGDSELRREWWGEFVRQAGKISGEKRMPAPKWFSSCLAESNRMLHILHFFELVRNQAGSQKKDKHKLCWCPERSAEEINESAGFAHTSLLNVKKHYEMEQKKKTALPLGLAFHLVMNNPLWNTGNNIGERTLFSYASRHAELPEFLYFQKERN